jgi:outer membrane lipoprotein carrier protein
LNLTARITARGIVAASLFPALLLASDPLAELSRAARYFQDGKAHTAEFTQRFLPAGFSRHQSESGMLTVQVPESLRFEYDSPAGKVFTFDGEAARFYTAAEKQMIVRRITAEERGTLPLVFLESPASVQKSYEISVEAGAGNGETAILLKPRAVEPEVAWIRLALRPEGSPSGLSYEAASGDRTEFRFGGFRVLPARPRSDFAFRPPPGTRIVENVR